MSRSTAPLAGVLTALSLVLGLSSCGEAGEIEGADVASATSAMSASSVSPTLSPSGAFTAPPRDTGSSSSPETEVPPREAQTVDPLTGQVQENALIRWDEWPEGAHLRAALYKTKFSPLMRQEFGEALDVVVYDAALAVAMSHVGLKGLYGPRSGPEASYYAPIKPYVTKSLWQALQTHIKEGQVGDSFYIGSFAPQTDRKGVWAEVDGVEYTSAGRSTIEFYGIPSVSMQETAINVAFQITVTGHGIPSDIQYDAVFTAVMELVDGSWLLNGWSNLITSDIKAPGDAASVGD